ncbi:MAG: hotdog fold thioesterase [Prevotella sp.]|nr:hotdog fold thioesterase [Prevotella sp.]
MDLKDYLNRFDRFAAATGVVLTEVGEGFAKAVMAVEERHLNGANVCQGGAIYTLADLAFAAAVNSHGLMTVGTNNGVTYLRSALKGDVLTAEAREENHHKLPFCEVRVTNQRGEIVCIMTGTAYRRNQPLVP